MSLPGESHGQKSQASYSTWGHKELDTTERLKLHHHQDLGEWWLMGWGRTGHKEGGVIGEAAQG